MPRSTTYLQSGYTYHLTHRCHDRRFLLGYARDRNMYREWLRQGVRRHGVSVYGYCITDNHVHVVAHADDRESISAVMHLAAGSTAKQYNIRKERMGAMWEHPFHCTKVQDGTHLLRCLVYVDLNMVRAGVVHHPRDWKWCGYHELTGRRTRYRILDVPRLISSLGYADLETFRSRYEEMITERIQKDPRREPCWTEAIAVGSKDYVEEAQARCTYRRRTDLYTIASEDDAGWILREPDGAYD